MSTCTYRKTGETHIFFFFFSSQHSIFCSQPSRTQITSLQFETEGDVVTADSDGFITVYSVDSEGAYFVRLEFEVRIKW